MNPPTPTPATHEVRIPCGEAWLYGDLVLPANFCGLVLFAHGSGSGRHSARNRQVAQKLQQAGIATLLFDLLTAQEEQVDVQTREHRFDISLLTRRMQDATVWAMSQPGLQQAPIGYFGASTGSAAAIIAAGRLGDRIAAVVSRGGRPDLAGPVALAAVTAPTLLIVGGADHEVIKLNEQALQQLRCDKQLAIVPGATHLFEERGTLAQVAELAAAWFTTHLARKERIAQGTHGTAGALIMTDVPLPFHDRRHAGRMLAEKLEHFRGRPNLLVLALPRGGVAVGFEVARALEAPLDIFVVRKLGFPGHAEYAMGAIASGGVRVMNPVPGLTVSPEAVAAVVAREQAELVRREQLYRGQRPAIDLLDRTVIVVDDGLATGSTMLAAVLAIRQRRPAYLAVAVPVGAEETCQELRDKADEVVCAATPRPFRGVGLWYEQFPQASDDEVRTLLEEAHRKHALSAH